MTLLDLFEFGAVAAVSGLIVWAICRAVGNEKDEYLSGLLDIANDSHLKAAKLAHDRHGDILSLQSQLKAATETIEAADKKRAAAINRIGELTAELTENRTLADVGRRYQDSQNRQNAARKAARHAKRTAPAPACPEPAVPTKTARNKPNSRRTRAERLAAREARKPASK